jgi:hypothetical protein
MEKDIIVYTDLESLVSLYINGDLPLEQIVFKYTVQPGREAWIHIDELKNQVKLGSVYPQASNKKGKK